MEDDSTALANIISDIKVLEHLKDRGTLQMYHINKVRDALDKYDNLDGATPTAEYRLKLALLRNRVKSREKDKRGLNVEQLT